MYISTLKYLHRMESSKKSAQQGMLTEEGILRKITKKDLTKNLFLKVYTEENNTNTSLWVSETLHHIEFPKKESKNRAYICKDLENINEVNLVIKTLKGIPLNTRALMHLIPLRNKRLSFLQKIKYAFFHYYVVSQDFLNTERVTDPKGRLKHLVELIKSTKEEETTGVEQLGMVNSHD